MSNIRLEWTFPTEREDGKPLAPDEISRVKIEVRVTGAPEFTHVTEVAAPATSFELEDVSPGTYHFRGSVFDAEDLGSGPAEVSVTVAAGALQPPKPLATFTATAVV